MQKYLNSGTKKSETFPKNVKAAYRST